LGLFTVIDIGIVALIS